MLIKNSDLVELLGHHLLLRLTSHLICGHITKALVGLCNFIQTLTETSLYLNLIVLEYFCSFGNILEILKALGVVEKFESEFLVQGYVGKKFEGLKNISFAWGSQLLANDADNIVIIHVFSDVPKILIDCILFAESHG